MKNYSFEKLGTLWEINLLDEVSDQTWQDFCQETKKVVTEFEQKYSRFNSNSLVYQLNHDKVLANPPQELLDFLNLGQKISSLTDQNYNLFLGKDLEKIGYGKSAEKSSRENTWQELSTQNLQKIKTQNFSYSKNQLTIHPDKKLDLGSIGKGGLVDILAKMMRDQKFEKFFIYAGGDIFCSFEKEFALENSIDLSEKSFLGKVKVNNATIAASGQNARRWKNPNDNKIYSHILKPNQQIQTVFSYSKTAILADSLATALFVSTPNQAQRLFKEFDLEFMLVFKDRTFFATEGYNLVNK